MDHRRTYCLSLIVVLSLACNLQARCETGQQLWNERTAARNEADAKESAYNQAVTDYNNADAAWGQAQQSLAAWEAKERDAEIEWINHWFFCNDCDAGNPDPQCDGDALHAWWNLCLYYVGVCTVQENEAYEAYCQAYVAKNEALTEWNDAEMDFEVCHLAYWDHVNGPPACGPCSE